MDKETILKLSGSAAKLCLSLLTSADNEDENSIIGRAGIRTFATYQKALQELRDAGLVQDIDGIRHIILRTVK